MLDIVRGALVFEHMVDFTRCLREIRGYPGVAIVRIKNRFERPTAYGWRDCLVNVVFAADPDRVICEIQLVHKRMLAAQDANPAAMADLVTYRAAQELLGLLDPHDQSSASERRVDVDSKDAAASPPSSSSGGRSDARKADADARRLLRQQRDLLEAQHAKELDTLRAELAAQHGKEVRLLQQRLRKRSLVYLSLIHI